MRCCIKVEHRRGGASQNKDFTLEAFLGYSPFGDIVIGNVLEGSLIRRNVVGAFEGDQKIAVFIDRDALPFSKAYFFTGL